MIFRQIRLGSYGKNRTLFLEFLICFAFCLIYISWGVDRFFSSIYAEDGAVYIQEATEVGPVASLTRTYAGYLDIPARIIGSIVSLLHPLHYAWANSSLLLLFVSSYQLIVFRLFYSITNSRFYSTVVAICFVAIPIGRFESLGNVTNLHFYAVSICLLLNLRLVTKGISNKLDLVLLLLISLSSPLSIIYSIFSLTYIVISFLFKRAELFQGNSMIKTLFIGTSVNIFVVATSLFIARDSAVSRLENVDFSQSNLLRTTYLFLDRVVASSFVPRWGNASLDSNGIVQFSSNLFSTAEIRSVVAALVLASLVLLFFKFEREKRLTLVVAITTVVSYSLLLGVSFGIQPRYALVASFGLQTLVFLILATRDTNGPRWFLGRFMLVVLLCLQLSSTRIESNLRDTKSSWHESVLIAQQKCANEKLKSVALIIPPSEAQSEWAIELACKKF